MKYYKKQLSDQFANYYAVQTLDVDILCLVIKNHIFGYDIVTDSELPDNLIEIDVHEFKSRYASALTYFQYWTL